MSTVFLSFFLSFFFFFFGGGGGGGVLTDSTSRRAIKCKVTIHLMTIDEVKTLATCLQPYGNICVRVFELMKH